MLELPLVEPMHAMGDLKKLQTLTIFGSHVTFLEYPESNLKIAH